MFDFWEQRAHGGDALPVLRAGAAVVRTATRRHRPTASIEDHRELGPSRAAPDNSGRLSWLHDRQHPVL